VSRVLLFVQAAAGEHYMNISSDAVEISVPQASQAAHEDYHIVLSPDYGGM
jgi:hypothetical protein